MTTMTETALPDANLFLEFIGTTWTLEGRRENGVVKGYATRYTGHTFTLVDGKIDQPAKAGKLPEYVARKLRKLIAETRYNATYFDCYIVAIDIDPAFVTIDPEDAAVVKGIRQVFVFDRNRHIHCAELTASYELHPLYDTMVFHDGVTVDDDDHLYELAEKYERNDSETEYHHVSPFDRYIMRNPHLVHRIGGYAVRLDWEGEGDETDYEEVLEYVIERYRGNHVF